MANHNKGQQGGDFAIALCLLLCVAFLLTECSGTSIHYLGEMYGSSNR